MGEVFVSAKVSVTMLGWTLTGQNQMCAHSWWISGSCYLVVNAFWVVYIYSHAFWVCVYIYIKTWLGQDKTLGILSC